MLRVHADVYVVQQDSDLLIDPGRATMLLSSLIEESYVGVRGYTFTPDEIGIHTTNLTAGIVMVLAKRMGCTSAHMYAFDSAFGVMGYADVLGYSSTATGMHPDRFQRHPDLFRRHGEKIGLPVTFIHQKDLAASCGGTPLL